MAEYHLSTPLSEEQIRDLHVGDTIYLSGQVFTCRSRLHRWVFDEGHASPAAAMERDALIHVGPIVLREDGKYQLVSFMPTSSIRFEKWGAKSVREWGLRMIIGKTTMGEETMKAMRELGCVHCSPQSVSPNLWCDSIEIDDVELFDELGTIEATWHMNLNELGPFVVDIDTHGRNLYDEHRDEVDANREAALRKLGIPEDFEYTRLY
ncbi:MAG: fumarate hydratase C-terminal domain-containing protein [Oscillospiraceae bacterium]|nr:fumarate hydratase C-terminal domain-containing protein [Oscillospiraceae bacterium]